MQQASATPKSPLLWVPTAYFSMGLVYTLLTNASAIMFKNLGMSNGKAAEYASYLILAYTVKPLFSPFIEMYRTKKFFVIAAQLAIGVGLLAVALAMSLPHYMTVLMLLLWLLSMLGATQDIATDGVFITALAGKAQSLYNGVQGLGWNAATILVTGGLVFLSGWLHTHAFHHDANVPGAAWLDAWQVIFVIVAAIAFVLPFWHRHAMPSGAPAANVPDNPRHAFLILLDTFVTLFQKRDIAKMILFALAYRLSVGFLQRIGPFFMVDPMRDGGLGLSNQQLGILYGSYGLVAVFAGAFLGGVFVSRRGTKASLFWLWCALNFPNLTFLLLAIYQPTNLTVIGVSVVVEKFFSGFGGLGLNIYLMQQLAPGKYTTTHYAFGTALAGLCMMFTGALSGHLEQLLGYRHYFIFVMLMVLPSLIMLRIVPFHIAENRN